MRFVGFALGNLPSNSALHGGGVGTAAATQERPRHRTFGPLLSCTKVCLELGDRAWENSGAGIWFSGPGASEGAKVR